MSNIIRAPGRIITVGEACLKRNPDLFRKLDPEAMSILNSTPLGKLKKKRIRQKSSDGMNKLEREAMQYLIEEDRRAKTGFLFRAHSLTLLLGNGCRYTVDITGFGAKPGEIHAWEVKGKHAWDDAIVKLKIAAHQWPSISFYLMWKDEGMWHTQHVLP